MLPFSVLRSLALLGRLETANQLIVMMTSNLKKVEAYLALDNLLNDCYRLDLHLLDNALNVAKSIGNKQERVSALADVAGAIARTGDKIGASNVLDEAFKLALSIVTEHERIKALRAVAEAMAKARDAAGALKVMG